MRIRAPRAPPFSPCVSAEFGLLIKQQLYFDRYTKILAPSLDPLRDSRIQMQMKVEGQEGGEENVPPVQGEATAAGGEERDGAPPRLAEGINAIPTRVAP